MGVKILENSTKPEDDGSCELLNYNLTWLRENCRCTECYNSTTNQRNVHPLNIPADISAKNCIISGDTVHITWNDEHESQYSQAWLQSQTEAEKLPEPILWSGDISDKVANIHKDELSTQEGLSALVKSILQFGAGFVNNVPPTLKGTEEVVNKIGSPMHTFYGAGMWELTDNLSYLDTAYTKVALRAHTDTTYFNEPVGLIVFHCTHHDGEGGQTLLVDGFRAANDVKRADPNVYNILKTVSTEFFCIDRQHHFACRKPSLSFTAQGQLEMIRYNVYDRSSRTPGSKNEVDNFYKGLKMLGGAISQPDGEWWLKLNPGTVLFFNNWRLLHGRSAYTGKRQITGCFMGMSNFLSKARLLKLLV